jgi:transcription elongation factor Elf1
MKKVFFDKKAFRKIRNQAIREKIDYEWSCPSCGYSVKSGFKKMNGWKYCDNCGKVLVSDFEKVYIEKEETPPTLKDEATIPQNME